MLPAAATPLLYLAFAAALLAAGARFVRPLSLWAALVVALLPLAFTGPAIVTGRVYAPLDLHYRTEPLRELREEVGLGDGFSRTRYDVAFQMIPWRKAARYAIKNGEWPLWNPFMLCGDVLAASAQPAVYHPIHVAAYLLPLGPSLTFVATAVLFVAGLGAFFFHREIGCREAAALVGAAGWMFCGLILFWTGWPLTMTVAFFPLLMLAVRRVVRVPEWRSAGLLAAAFVLVLLAGHPETAFHCIAVAMVYGVCETVAARGRSTRAAIGLAVLAGVVALLLCAVDLLPMLEATPQTVLYHRRQAATGDSWRAPWSVALERMRVAVVPFAYGVPWSEWLRQPSKFGAHWYPYTGSVLLAPALFGLWRGRWRGRWLLLGFAVAGLLLFVAAPGLIDLLAHVPLFDVAINRRLVFVTGFAVAACAALGVEAWARQPHSRRLGWLTLGVLGALSLALAAFWPGLREADLSADFLAARTLLELVPLALAAALFLTVRSVRIGLGGLLVILVAQRVAQTAELNPTYPQALLAPAVAAFEVLPAGAEPYRIVGQGNNSLTPNLGTLYELEDVRGATPLTNWRLSRTFPLWQDPRQRSRAVPQPGDLNRPFLSFLNVRYALVARPGHPPAGWTPRFEGRRLGVYENPRALPRAFVPRRVRFVAPDDKTWLEMMDAADFSRLAWIEAAAGEPLRRMRNGPGRVKVERRGLGLHLDVEMQQPGWVVASETAWTGWRAMTRGRELPLHFANHAFLAFHLPAGRHPVDLVYRPRSFVVGRAISLATAGGILILVLGARRRRGGSSPTERTGYSTSRNDDERR